MSSRYRDERRHKERGRFDYTDQDDISNRRQRGGRLAYPDRDDDRPTRADYARPFPCDERIERSPRPPREPAERSAPFRPMVEVSCFIRHDYPDNHRIGVWNGRKMRAKPDDKGEQEELWCWLRRDEIEIKHHAGRDRSARSVIAMAPELAQKWELDPA
jgi:hypothetical protein